MPLESFKADQKAKVDLRNTRDAYRKQAFDAAEIAIALAGQAEQISISTFSPSEWKHRRRYAIAPYVEFESDYRVACREDRKPSEGRVLGGVLGFSLMLEIDEETHLPYAFLPKTYDARSRKPIEFMDQSVHSDVYAEQEDQLVVRAFQAIKFEMEKLPLAAEVA